MLTLSLGAVTGVASHLRPFNADSPQSGNSPYVDVHRCTSPRVYWAARERGHTMSNPVITVLAVGAAATAAVTAGCGSTKSAAVTVCAFMQTGGLNAGVNMPGDVTPGESVSLEAYNPGAAVRLHVSTFTVGGYEGLSGNVAGPDTITVNRTFTIPAHAGTPASGGDVTLATFPINDPGVEDVPGTAVLESVNGIPFPPAC